MSFPPTDPPPPPRHTGWNGRSHAIAMRDGVRLAVDVAVPRGPADGRYPALFAATRYWRASQLRRPWRWFITPGDAARAFFTAYGYALVRIDVRGTGASEGHQRHPWPDSDLTDLYDLVAWVIAQPWSDGRVGAFGNSYQGTTAELLGACGHPAVTSALVRFNEFDVYRDIAFPGGVPNVGLLRAWSASNRALDANRVPAGAPWPERLLVRGVRPVDGAPIPHHDNRQVDSVLQHVVCRDDRDPELGVTLDQLSMHTRPTTHRLDHWGSWFDAATADAVISRFISSPRPQRAVIGPWNHGASQHVGRRDQPFTLRQQMVAALRQFEDAGADRTLHYFTLFASTWTCTTTWPPAGTAPLRWYLRPAGGLATHPAPGASAQFTVDPGMSTGRNNRWLTELDGRPVRYAAIRASLAFTTPPLADDLTICGHPVVRLWLSSTHADGNVFVYLEALDAQGVAHYLTEGMLRVIHRAIAAGPPAYWPAVPYRTFARRDLLPLVPGEPAALMFGLQPIAAWLQRGWRLRLSLAGADADTFAQLPPHATPTITLALGGDDASWLDLPTLAPAAGRNPA